MVTSSLCFGGLAGIAGHSRRRACGRARAGHLSGRLLLRREPFKINQQAVIDACADTGTWLELNAQPSRFDLDWRLWVQNRGRGIKCSINCDAHSLLDVEYLRFGIGQARKAWLTKADVINTFNLSALRELLGAKRAKLG